MAVGISLTIAAILALMISNSTSYQIYQDFFAINLPLSLDFIGISKEMTLLDWINDFLMAIFFLLVGLELKKEILLGELSTNTKRYLPFIAACGGVIMPILIFCFFNKGNAENMRGFAIPCATDIAFAYGAIALFGKKISNSLKVFVVALAVIDDLIAILIIAFFYSDNIDLTYILLSCFALLLLAILNFFSVKKILPYLLCGIFLWLMVLKTGIHASLAGVLLSMFIPMKVSNEPLLPKLAHQIAPAVNFLILPIFAFANAGVRIENFSYDIFLQPVVLGIVAGLFFGKQIGVMLFSFIAIKLKISAMPSGANWLELYIAAIFTAIGFTMSLFIAGLSFDTNQQLFDEAKIGILFGSLLSVIFASLIIFIIKPTNNKK